MHVCVTLGLKSVTQTFLPKVPRERRLTWQNKEWARAQTYHDKSLPDLAKDWKAEVGVRFSSDIVSRNWMELSVIY